MPISHSPTPAIPRARSPSATPATVSSGELLSPQGTLRIDHKGAIYTLRATSKGGLILTK